MQKKGLVACVLVNEPKAPEKDSKKSDTADAVVSMVPQNKLAAADLWAAYGKPKPGTFVICDEFGNEYFRSTEKKLEKTVSTLRKKVKELRAKLAGKVKEAQELIDAGNQEAALKEILSGFKLDLSGWEEATQAATLYNGMMERARVEIAASVDDETKLKALKNSYAKSDVSAEIDAALKALADKAAANK